MHLVDYHRYDKVAYSGKEEHGFEQCDEYGYDTSAKVEQATIELNKGLENVCNETCDKEWQQYPFEYIDKPQCSTYKYYGDDQAYHPVQGIWLTF